jgi:hypothetical protein
MQERFNKNLDNDDLKLLYSEFGDNELNEIFEIFVTTNRKEMSSDAINYYAALLLLEDKF